MTAMITQHEAPRVHLRAVPSSDMVDLVSPPGMDEVRGAMWSLTSKIPSSLATTMVEQHLATGGKRLRARLALASSAALGAQFNGAIWWAAAVELLHNATLIHDDIQDGDQMRRGKPTLWTRHGTTQAMNAGDLMLMLPYLAVAQVETDQGMALCRGVAEHAVTTVCGQIQELELLPHGRTSWDEYRKAIAGKTGPLLGLPVFGAALLAGRSLDQANRLSEAFSVLGVLFQLQDDVLDLYGAKGRNIVGSDLYEGKVSALVVAHLKRRPGDRDWLLTLLRSPRAKTSEEEVAFARQAFIISGALNDTLDRIDGLAEATYDCVALQDEPRLRDVALCLVELALRPIAHCRELSKGGKS